MSVQHLLEYFFILWPERRIVWKTWYLFESDSLSVVCLTHRAVALVRTVFSELLEDLSVKVYSL